MGFQKGQSGNPLGGKVKRKPISEMYERILTQEPEKLRAFCEKQLDLAIAGDVQAAKEITDRVEGKALQSLDVSDNRQSDSAQRVRDIFKRAIEKRAEEDGGRSGSVQ